MPDLTPEQLAESWHNAYDRLAPSHGFRAPGRAQAWHLAPSDTRKLMIAVATEVLEGALAPMREDLVTIRDARERILEIEAKARRDSEVINRIREASERLSKTLVVHEPEPRSWWRR